MRPKKTEVCQTCARAKHVCQTCLLDLEFGLPVQVRDEAMAAANRQLTIVPKSDGTREYTAAQNARALRDGHLDAVYQAPMANSVAQRARRVAPRFERNRTRVCSFFLRGQCSRGLYCPYRHERPDAGNSGGGADEGTGAGAGGVGVGLDRQNLRDRYYGVNDPVAEQILARYQGGRGPRRGGAAPGAGAKREPPSDQSVKTLFVSGVKEGVEQSDVRGLFGADGGVVKVSVHAERGFAFVEFDSRHAAEAGFASGGGGRVVNGAQLMVAWGKSKKRSRAPANGAGTSAGGGDDASGRGGKAAMAAAGGGGGGNETCIKRARTESVTEEET